LSLRASPDAKAEVTVTVKLTAYFTGAREQWNSATPLIDASPVYGHEYAQNAIIRDPNSYGLLRTHNPYE
jgi:hypothetical protein